MLAGAVVGAACGAIGLTLALLVAEHGGLAGFPNVFAAMVGAAAGMFVTPLLAWGLLRYVPLGRAIAQCALGTLAGGIAAYVLRMNDPMAGPMLGALAGFALAAVRLRIVTPRTRFESRGARNWRNDSIGSDDDR